MSRADVMRDAGTFAICRHVIVSRAALMRRNTFWRKGGVKGDDSASAIKQKVGRSGCESGQEFLPTAHATSSIPQQNAQLVHCTIRRSATRSTRDKECRIVFSERACPALGGRGVPLSCFSATGDCNVVTCATLHMRQRVECSRGPAQTPICRAVSQLAHDSAEHNLNNGTFYEAAQHQNRKVNDIVNPPRRVSRRG